MPARRSSTPLERDAADLYDAATAFIRHYQFRSRDQALRLGLTVMQAYTLDILRSGTGGGRSLTQLAEALRLDKSTASRIIAGMSRRGLVEWERTAHDRRAMSIVASVDGKRRYERLRRAIERHNARLLASYAAAERRGAIEILRELVQRAAVTPRRKRRR